MKKTMALLMSIILCICCPLTVFASDVKPVDLSDWISSYSKVMDRVYEKTGEQLSIPEGMEESVYEYYKDYTFEEIEQSLLKDVAQYKASALAKTDHYEISSKQVESVKEVGGTRSIREDIVQSCPIEYNSTIVLGSTVFGAGNPVSYRYESIRFYYVTWPSNYTGFHFAPTHGMSHSLSNGNKHCTVTATGSPQNAAGVTLTVLKTIRVTFYV